MGQFLKDILKDINETVEELPNIGKSDVKDLREQQDNYYYNLFRNERRLI